MITLVIYAEVVKHLLCAISAIQESCVGRVAVSHRVLVKITALLLMVLATVNLLVIGFVVRVQMEEQWSATIVLELIVLDLLQLHHHPTAPLPPPPAVKAVVAVAVETELLVFPIPFVVQEEKPAVTRAVAVEEAVVPPTVVWVFLAPKVRRVVTSDVVANQTAMCRNQQVGGVTTRGGIVMEVARRTIGQPVLVGVETVPKPTTAEQRAHVLLMMAH